MTTLDPTLLPEAFVRRLRTRWLGRAFHYHAEVSSTNDEVAALAHAGAPQGAVVLAEVQRVGRGRQGRRWHSEPGQNLTFSILLRPGWRAPEVPPLSLGVAVGVAAALERYLPEPPTVKWPNDLLSRGRKLSGILVELASEGERLQRVTLGVGVNVNQERFEAELAPIATSLALERGGPVERAAVLASVLEELEPWLEALLGRETESVLAAWTARASWLGEELVVRTAKGPVRGVALGLDGAGALRLRTADGAEQRILSGDLELGEGGAS
ncbi:MAG: biotin--[acetyl-CoA-carboxylase] ligase [Deltaproteobacteria bacterium]|nr:biotin--[acetyl-CoA-carboxylase] ligase [Deltaproteobacteria bacterium]